jgi:post-segregation antitoxin (ccd killing protein)
MPEKEKYVKVNLTVSKELLERVDKEIGLENINLSALLAEEIKTEVLLGNKTTTYVKKNLTLPERIRNNAKKCGISYSGAFTRALEKLLKDKASSRTHTPEEIELADKITDLIVSAKPAIEKVKKRSDSSWESPWNSLIRHKNNIEKKVDEYVKDLGEENRDRIREMVAMGYSGNRIYRIICSEHNAKMTEISKASNDPYYGWNKKGSDE